MDEEYPALVCAWGMIWRTNIIEYQKKNGMRKYLRIPFCIIDKDFKYVKGTKVVLKEVDSDHYGDVSGIYFVLSRADAEKLSYEEGE